MEWIEIAQVTDFGPGNTRLVTVDDTEIAVINIEGEFLAIENTCSHAGSQLVIKDLDPSDQINGTTITCPHHGALFCLRTGQALGPPAWEPVRVFNARVHEGMVQIQTSSD